MGVDDAMDAAKDDDDDGQSGTRPPTLDPSLIPSLHRIAFAVLCCVADEADVWLAVSPPISPSFPDTALTMTEKPFGHTFMTGHVGRCGC